MHESQRESTFSEQLLKQEPLLNDSQYEEYRMHLEQMLVRAERRQQLAGYVVGVSAVLMLVLMFVGGSKVLGDFDPWSKGANPLSITLGVAFIASSIVFWVSLASYFSRFRVRVRSAQEQVRDSVLVDLQRQVQELRSQLTSRQ